jgi:hypothetical protein
MLFNLKETGSGRTGSLPGKRSFVVPERTYTILSPLWVKSEQFFETFFKVSGQYYLIKSILAFCGNPALFF